MTSFLLCNKKDILKNVLAVVLIQPKMKPVRPSFETCTTFVHLFGIEIKMDCNIIATSKAHKGSKHIVEIVHVTTVVKPYMT